MKKMIIAAAIAAGTSITAIAQAEPMSREALSVYKAQASSPSAISAGKDNSFLGKYRTFDGRVNESQVVDTEIAAFEMVSDSASRRYSARSDRNN